MPLILFDHYTIRAADIAASTKFYVDAMGLRAQPIDGFEFPITLLFLGDRAIVHLLGTGPALDKFLGRRGPAYLSGPERGTGNMEHVAFNATGLADFLARLRKYGTEAVERTLAGHGTHQLLFDDPDGIEIEVNFPLAEKTG